MIRLAVDRLIGPPQRFHPRIAVELSLHLLQLARASGIPRRQVVSESRTGIPDERHRNPRQFGAVNGVDRGSRECQLVIRSLQFPA